MNLQLKKHIDLLKKRGYEIRFPGGKSRDGSFACFGTIVRADFRKGRLYSEVLVIPYLSPLKDLKDDLEEKTFPEQPEQTLEREIHEETGVLINKGEYALMNTLEVSDNREGYEGKKHIKYGYFIYRYDISNMRRNISPYQRNIGVPFWMPINPGLETHISPSHLWILKDLLREINTPVLKSTHNHRPLKNRKKNRLLPVSA